VKVSGYISDSYGKTDGASIQLFRDGVGTTLGVSSNQDGYFEIENEDIKPNDNFEVSFLGLKSQTFKASELDDLKIYLDEDIEQLDEVVIIANIGKSPKFPTVEIKKWKQKWYTHPAFALGVLGIATTVVIVYIIKKTR